MKIAIGISGIYRSKLYYDPINSIKEIQNKFDADIYFHTWDEYKNEVPEIFKKDGYFFTSQEPEINYHPIFDPESTSNPKHIFLRKEKINLEKTKYANKQILGYCNLFDCIPKKYDLYIRTRWDVMINPQFNFERFYRFCDQGPVGFMIRETGPNRYSLRNKEGKVVTKKKSKSNNDWHDMISDYLIMHKEEHLNTKEVYFLHENKQLLGAEFGWWQILSKPFGGNNHTSVYGGVILVRQKKRFVLDENFMIRRIFVN